MKKLLYFLFAIFLLAGCANPQVTAEKAATQSSPLSQDNQVQPGQSGMLTVHFIDVGQGDSILVQLPTGQNMLVDAGTNASTNTVVNYLKKTRVKKIDYLVGTHPHEDHIGGMDAVVNTFDIGKIYMPKATANTKTFRDVLAAIKDKGLTITTARAGVDMLEDGNLSVKIMAPCGTKYEDLNNYSAVIKVKYGDVAFLLMGDAEALSESEILASKADVKTQVLKVGHHGSNSSTSDAFLKAVAPQHAVISVGANNDYHHPHGVTLEKLRKAKVQILRTDEMGTIIFFTDGKEISISSSSEK